MAKTPLDIDFEEYDLLRRALEVTESYEASAKEVREYIFILLLPWGLSLNHS